MNTSSDWELEHMTEAQDYFEKNGVLGIAEFCKTKLGRWKDVEINIGVTGNSGAGKSSFINAIRGLGDEDDGAAEIGVTETTTMPTVYPHPTNEKIKFWDLPGIGTPNYPDFQTYCEKVKLKKYDFFLLLTTNRFTENDRLLVKKVKLLNKSLFFIRTHVDVDYVNERRKKSFDEQEMLKKIKEDCWKNMQDSQADKVFLISNIYRRKWEFGHLTQAILDVLPCCQKECLTLVLTSLSTDMVKKKADVLRGRIWMTAAASAVTAVIPIPVPGMNIAVDLALLIKEVNFYKSQLGLPDKKSDEFQRMTLENQKKVRKFGKITTALRMAEFLRKFAKFSPVEELARFIPIVGTVVAGGISFTTTYYFLHYCVKELESAAQDFTKKMASEKVDDFELEINMETKQHPSKSAAKQSNESSLCTPAKPVENDIPKPNTPVSELKTKEEEKSDDLKEMTSRNVNDFEPENNMETKQHSSMRAAQQSNESSLCTPAKPIENNIPKPNTPVSELKTKEEEKSDDLKEMTSRNVNDFEPEINMETKQRSSKRAGQQSNKSSLCTPAKLVENNIPKPSTHVNKLKTKEKRKSDDLKEIRGMLSVVMTKLEKLDHTERKLKDIKSKINQVRASLKY